VTFDFQPPSSEAAIEWALAYSRAGMAVFPCNANGMPSISKAQGGAGVYDATTDADRIGEFWAMFPHAEIGWGVPAAVVVVDLDVKKGKRGLKDFFDRAGVEPDSVETPIAVTASGGRHLIYAACGKAFQNKVAIGGTGIDFRTAGGYVVLPRKGNGRAWLKPLSTPFAPAPSWLPTKPSERPIGEARPFTGNATPAALDALKDACEEIEAALPGVRNDAINCASYHIGRRIGAGRSMRRKRSSRSSAPSSACSMWDRTWGATSARSSPRSPPARRSRGRNGMIEPGTIDRSPSPGFLGSRAPCQRPGLGAGDLSRAGALCEPPGSCVIAR